MCVAFNPLHLGNEPHDRVHNNYSDTLHLVCTGITLVVAVGNYRDIRSKNKTHTKWGRQLIK